MTHVRQVSLRQWHDSGTASFHLKMRRDGRKVRIQAKGRGEDKAEAKERMEGGAEFSANVVMHDLPPAIKLNFLSPSFGHWRTRPLPKAPTRGQWSYKACSCHGNEFYPQKCTRGQSITLGLLVRPVYLGFPG